MVYKGFEAVIGLEVHVELKTESKVFCSCSAAFGGEPNTQCCPVCMGMPGALPVLNGKAVDFAVTAGLAFGCRIAETAWFDRKNYFYPDLPKGYQITQAEAPFCVGGEVPLRGLGYEKSVRLRQIHLEEDAGKLTHTPEGTLIDFNRCGVPLIEIVSEPDITTAEEAKAYLNELRRVLLFMGISDCRMNEGSLRCDVNVSVHRPGEPDGERCEVKNLNSVSYVGKAVEYEIRRQADLIDAGERVVRETRRFNEDTGKTESMRRKEGEVDYRYFTEPNIPAVRLTAGYVEDIKRRMPIMPEEAKKDLINRLNLGENGAELITQTPKIYGYYLDAAGKTRYPVQAANLLVGEILTVCGEDPGEYLAAEHLADTADLFGDERVTSNVAKQLIRLSAETGEKPEVLAERKGLYQIRDEGVLRALLEESLTACPKALEDFRKGKETAKKTFLGYVMKATAGRADARLCAGLLDELLQQLK